MNASHLLAVPDGSDWIVAIRRAKSGAVVKYRVAPGSLSETEAVKRALRAGRIPLDDVADVELCRANEHVRIGAEDYETELAALIRRRKGIA